MSQPSLALSTENLLANAREYTGIDLDDVAAQEPLSQLLVSLNNESALHAKGVVAMKCKLSRLLNNRLRMQRDLQNYPEILEQEITAPVFICGMARTGTTLLQQMLAASEKFNTLPFWQVLNPALVTGDPNESPASRMADAAAFITEFNAASPVAQHAHPFSTQSVEEETLMLEQSLLSPSFACWSHVSQYEKSLSTNTDRKMLFYFKTQLQYIQWQGLANNNKRWILKCPWYFGMLPALREVFPDAQLIVTHRDPAQSAPSTLYLLEQFYLPYTNNKPNATQWVMRLALATRRYIKERAEFNADQILDILYASLCDDADRLIKNIEEFIAVPLSNTLQSKAAKQQDKKQRRMPVVPSYSLAEYGLTPALIHTLFAPYREFIAKNH